MGRLRLSRWLAEPRGGGRVQGSWGGKSRDTLEAESGGPREQQDSGLVWLVRWAPPGLRSPTGASAVTEQGDK